MTEDTKRISENQEDVIAEEMEATYRRSDFSSETPGFCGRLWEKICSLLKSENVAAENQKEERLRQLLTDEGFVRKLRESKTLENFQSLLAQRGVDLPQKELLSFLSSASENEELDAEELRQAAGGVKLDPERLLSGLMQNLGAGNNK